MVGLLAQQTWLVGNPPFSLICFTHMNGDSSPKWLENGDA
jgi:hypothetical protein